MTIQIPNEEASELTESKEAQKIDVDTSWRHGHRDTWVVPYRGKFYQFTIDVHTNEGWQFYSDSITAVEVVPGQIQVTQTVWKAVQP